MHAMLKNENSDQENENGGQKQWLQWLIRGRRENQPNPKPKAKEMDNGVDGLVTFNDNCTHPNIIYDTRNFRGLQMD